MDQQRKARQKELKRAYKAAKRKTVVPWKAAAVLLAALTLIATPVNILLHVFDNTAAAFVGGTFWELENPDPNAVYFQGDFAAPEEMIDYGLDVCRRVEAEGAVLLMNENAALPLAGGARVSLFSTSCVNLVYGGTGSGNIDASAADTLKTALERSGLSVNGALWSFYTAGPGKDYVRDSGGFTSSAAVGEAPWSAYTDEVKASVAGYGDAAIVVLSRVGGEGVDLSFQGVNYLALDENERDLMKNLAELKAAGTIQSIVVLLNTANPLQLDFLKNNEYTVDACLWIGDVGITGVNAVADILAGRVNPSGSLPDTYCYDNFSAPAMANFVPTVYEGYVQGEIPDHAKSYMIYQEGIYVGYKYYETRYEDMVLGTGSAGDFDYSAAVAFPFGHGLSYTTFEYGGFSLLETMGNLMSVSVAVTNTGGVPGKETVQIYAQSPYTDYDKRYGVEKASVQLVGFGKTEELAPGQSQTLEITVDRRDLASYDAYGAGAYILEPGRYYLTAAADAHNAVNNILAAKGCTRAGGMDGDGTPALTCAWTEEALSTFDSANGTPIVNRLSSADPNLYGGVDEEVRWVSRSDWTGTLPREIVKLTLTDTLKRELQDVRYDPADYPAAEMPIMGAADQKKPFSAIGADWAPPVRVTLYNMIGRDYDAPLWSSLLDQLTFDEMVSLIGDAFHWTMPVKSVEAPGTRDENGPQGLTASLLGSDATQLAATAFTSEDVMAASFNVELMAEVGKVIGNNCLESGVACLYGPGSNIHRTPYGGRNFEYYSEDGFLSGAICAPEVAAIQAKGVNVVMKHFALNDCEQDRIGLGVWLSEQAAREIYLKAFQAPIEQAGGNGVMMAYTRWGAQWSGGSQGLGEILRQEWGCSGMNITDNVLTTYVNGPDGLLAGTSIYDAMMPYVTRGLSKYRDDPVIVSAMREACHHNLYAIANSCAMNGVGPHTTIKVTQPAVVTIAAILNCAAAFFLAVCAAMWILKARKLRKTPEYSAWKSWKAGQR